MRQAVKTLMDLAAAKGFRIERGVAFGTYRLVEERSNRALVNMRRSTSFSIIDGLRVLRRLPDTAWTPAIAGE
jgi:hypothetical protein